MAGPNEADETMDTQRPMQEEAPELRPAGSLSTQDLSSAMAAALAAVEKRPTRETARPTPQEDAMRAVQLLAELSEERRITAKLRTDLEQTQGDLAQTRKRFQKLDQDQEDVRKRLQRAELDLPHLGARQLLTSLLPALDDLDALLDHLGARETLTEQGQEAVAMLRDRWQKALQAGQVMTFDAVGQRFDPAVHEVIAQVADADLAEGTVVRQAGKGYLLGGKLLRCARVVVSKAAADSVT
jgi:molecular chaperone GrpE